MIAPTSAATAEASPAILVSPGHCRAASSASRVLPQPAGPVRHTSWAAASRSRSWVSSSSRPTKLVGGTGSAGSAASCRASATGAGRPGSASLRSCADTWLSTVRTDMHSRWSAAPTLVTKHDMEAAIRTDDQPAVNGEAAASDLAHRFTAALAARDAAALRSLFSSELDFRL